MKNELTIWESIISITAHNSLFLGCGILSGLIIGCLGTWYFSFSNRNILRWVFPFLFLWFGSFIFLYSGVYVAFGF